jgi:hypothetical protein
MQRIEYRNLAISGIISVVLTPVVGGAVMGYLEQGNSFHNIVSGAVLGTLLALLFGGPYILYLAYISSSMGGWFSSTDFFGFWALIVIAVIPICAVGSLLGGFIARLTRRNSSAT